MSKEAISKDKLGAEMLTEIGKLINEIDKEANESLWLSMFLITMKDCNTANEFLSRLQIELGRIYALLSK